MTRINVLLLILVIACALGVVTSQHRARKLFIELESEQAAARKLDEEFTQLGLEQSTWGTNKRIESVASKQLGMRLPDAASTVVVTLDRPSSRPSPQTRGAGDFRVSPSSRPSPRKRGEGDLQ